MTDDASKRDGDEVSEEDCAEVFARVTGGIADATMWGPRSRTTRCVYRALTALVRAERRIRRLESNRYGSANDAVADAQHGGRHGK